MSGFTIVVHPCWLEDAALDAFRAMVTHGTGVYVQQDLSAKAIPLEDWIAGQRPAPELLKPSTVVQVIPKNTPRSRPYYRRGRW